MQLEAYIETLREQLQKKFGVCYTDKAGNNATRFYLTRKLDKKVIEVSNDELLESMNKNEIPIKIQEIL